MYSSSVANSVSRRMLPLSRSSYPVWGGRSFASGMEGRDGIAAPPRGPLVPAPLLPLLDDFPYRSFPTDELAQDLMDAMALGRAGTACGMEGPQTTSSEHVPSASAQRITAEKV